MPFGDTVTPAGFAGIDWSEVPLTRREKASKELAQRINLELVTDKVISEEEWKLYESGAERAASIITAEDLDGYYLGKTSLYPQAARYANEAARENGIYLPHADPRDFWMKVTAFAAFAFIVASVLESLTRIPYVDWYPQSQMSSIFLMGGVLSLMVCLLMGVTHGDSR